MFKLKIERKYFLSKPYDKFKYVNCSFICSPGNSAHVKYILVNVTHIVFFRPISITVYFLINTLRLLIDIGSLCFEKLLHCNTTVLACLRLVIQRFGRIIDRRRLSRVQTDLIIGDRMIEEWCGKTSKKEIIAYANNSPMVFSTGQGKYVEEKKRLSFFISPTLSFYKKVVTFFHRRKEKNRKNE